MVTNERRDRTVLDETGSQEIDAEEADLSSLPVPVVRKQIQLLEDLYENPPVIDFKDDLAEFAVDESARDRRISELKDRLKWLRMILEVTEGELELITRAKSDYFKRQNGG